MLVSDPEDIPLRSELLHRIFSHTRDPLCVVDGGIVLATNPAVVRLLGHPSAAAVEGTALLELIDPEVRAVFQAPTSLCTTRLQRRDGSTFAAELRAITIEEGRCGLIVIRPLGDEVMGEQGLYEAIFAKNTAIKLLIDPSDGQIVDASEGAVAFYGWSLDVLRSMNIMELNTLPPEAISAELRRAEQGKRRYFRFRHRVASGEIRHVDVHTGRVEVRGRPMLLSIVQDTTEREDLEAQLHQSQRLDAIGQLAGGVAHDFNNLIALILACGEQIRSELPGEGSVRETLDELMLAAVRASELTRQLLAVGQQQQLAPQQVALDAVLERSQALLSRAVGPGVQLCLELQPGLVVEADPGQIEQVVMNLALNAREATEGRGRVDVVLEQNGDRAVIRVRDDGRGMDAATRSRVFEPFFTTRPSEGGAGLGLASVYGIVNQSGGVVTVQSEIGRGSTFSVFLPLSASHHTQPPLPHRVLLVDDDVDLREVLAESMRGMGFGVVSLASGAEALALSAEQLDAVDVLVTDHAMPGVTGVRLAQLLSHRKPSLGVLLISGHVSAIDRSALPARARFLSKPFSRRTLARTLRQLLADEPIELP